MIFGISAHASAGYSNRNFSVDSFLMKSGSSESLSFIPFGAFGGGDGVSTISSNWGIETFGSITKLEHAR